ncbi:MAG: type II secretion system protein [Planctomycetes bacterium]|nr:type II secretion system protein [Planctomycetota bacterium]
MNAHPNQPRTYRRDSAANIRDLPETRLGFSLIELLVVVAIIGLLVGILVPTLMNVRENTRLVVCQSNLRSIAMAWHAYLRDNRERVPRGFYVGTTFGGKQGKAPNYGGDPNAPPDKRRRILNRYLGIEPIVTKGQAVEVFRCPGDTGSFISADGGTDTVYSRHWDYYGTSYRSNRYVIGPTPPRASWNDPCWALIDDLRRRFDQLSLSLSNAPNESRLVLVGNYGFDDWQNPAQDKPPVEFHTRSYRGHSGVRLDLVSGSRHNLAFMDGHAAFTEVRKGIYVAPLYTLIPFRDMQDAFREDQAAGYSPP